MSEDIFEQIEEICDKQHELIIDNAPLVRLTDGKSVIVAKRVEIGEDKIESYWCPETYTELKVPKEFKED